MHALDVRCHQQKSISRRGRRIGKISWASQLRLHSLWHGDQCREDQADDERHLWHQHRDQSKWTEAWGCHKLRGPGLSYNWWGFQAWDTLHESTDNSSIDKVATSLDWQEYFSQLQDTTDALSCHIHLPVCLWIGWYIIIGWSVLCKDWIAMVKVKVTVKFQNFSESLSILYFLYHWYFCN